MAQPTSTHPFFKSPFSRQPGLNRRRSTRIDLVIPVVLSGRDSKGVVFRDASQTATVNLHGAKVSTSREILVGMLVTIENPGNGVVAKAVCVRIYESGPGEEEHCIALQLVRPGNIWGVENPPDDWGVVEANVLGTSAAAPRAGSKQVEGGAPDSAMPVVESQAVPLEQQAAGLADTLFQELRQQIEVLINAALQGFESRLKALKEEAAGEMESQIKESLVGAASVADAMQEDAAAQLAARAAETVAAAEQELRAKLAAILASFARLSSSGSPAKPGPTLTRK
jgi:hypothetical protein